MKDWIVARLAWMDKELSLTDVDGEEGTDVPSLATLGQNYPNPFNPGTTIPFVLGSAAHVSIVVFDVLGREVSRLTDTDFAPGEHAVVFDGSGMASGIYICRMITTPAATGPALHTVRQILLMR